MERSTIRQGVAGVFINDVGNPAFDIRCVVASLRTTCSGLWHFVVANMIQLPTHIVGCETVARSVNRVVHYVESMYLQPGARVTDGL